MKRIQIEISPTDEGVYLATSPDLKGLAVESEDREEISALAQAIAADMMALEGCGNNIAFDIRMEGQKA